jgi:hypothetical protein
MHARARVRARACVCVRARAQERERGMERELKYSDDGMLPTEKCHIQARTKFL